MSADPMQTLNVVSQFLDGPVAGGVSADLQSEVRAAAKVLKNLAQEIDCLPALLLAECRAMVELQASATAQLSKVAPDIADAVNVAQHLETLAQPLGPLSELLALHASIQSDAELILSRLQAELRNQRASADQVGALTNLARGYFELFGKQAAARLRWQSVFPKQRKEAASESRSEEVEK